MLLEQDWGEPLKKGIVWARAILVTHFEKIAVCLEATAIKTLLS
jgi:hypothetical protein|tara:strand:+ start:105 stop:236 length:132 start_codon:yes stop_codon:yes gene_type:complete